MVYAKPEKLYVEREKPFVKRDTFSNVNRIGYVTIAQQVNSLLIAGERLLSYKRKLYEFPDGEFDEDTVMPDPTLDVGFDLADYSFYESQLAKKLSQQRKAVATSLKSDATASAGKSEGEGPSDTSAPTVE